MPRSLAYLAVLLPFTLAMSAGCGGDSTTSDSTDAGDDGSADDTMSGDTRKTETGVADTTPGETGADTGGELADGAADADADAASVADTKSDTGVADTETGARLGPAPVLLGTAGNYVMLAKSALSTVPASVITGDLGISPAAASYATGFSMTKAGTYWTATQVIGKIYAADNDAPTPALLTTAVTNMLTAYTDAAGRPTPDFLNLGVGAIGGLTLTPGLYKWTSSVTIASDVTISGGATDTWIFQITGDLMESAAKHVKLLGGAKAKNIVWQVAGLVDLGTTSHLEGVILCKTGITLRTGASINGRLLAQTAINIDSSSVSLPTP